MASLSCRISPRTSTVILRDRSPLATAMVTSEMLRTWAVRLLAIELTLSVSSRHTPVTSLTLAWPPSLPSVPTSRATRVTSEVNTESCLIIVLTMVAARKNSPFRGRPSTSRRTVCSRSPCATAPITRVTSVVGQTRSSIRPLTEVSMSPHAAVARANFTRWRVRPCSPTDLPMRSSCWDITWLAPTISLNSTEIRSMAPPLPAGSRTEKSPRRTASRACCNSFSSVPVAPFWPLAERRTGAGGGDAEALAVVSTSAVMQLFLSLDRSLLVTKRSTRAFIQVPMEYPSSDGTGPETRTYPPQSTINAKRCGMVASSR